MSFLWVLFVFWLLCILEMRIDTLPEHLRSSPPVFSGVRVTRSLVLCVCFIDHCLSFCTFSFDHCVVCSSLIYGVISHEWGKDREVFTTCGRYPWSFVIQIFKIYDIVLLFTLRHHTHEDYSTHFVSLQYLYLHWFTRHSIKMICILKIAIPLFSLLKVLMHSVQS
jgi:hypothetical protein